jgi:putative membrane protein
LIVSELAFAFAHEVVFNEGYRTMTQYFAGLPAFLAYFGVSVALLIAFGFVYTKLTPHNEFDLIKANKSAGAIAFGGSLLGFVLPLLSAILNSVSLLDCLLWGVVALIVQILTFFSLRLFVRDLSERIARDEIASGVFVAFASVSVGVLNAASMTS